MATWQLSNRIKKTVVDLQFWQKEGQTIIYETVYRSGLWECEKQTRPNINLNNEDGFEVVEREENWELLIMSDGISTSWNLVNVPGSEEVMEEISSFLNDEGSSGLEERGWNLVASEHWIHGPLKLSKKDTGEEWEGRVLGDKEVD
jgi:hypothetical protein